MVAWSHAFMVCVWSLLKEYLRVRTKASLSLTAFNGRQKRHNLADNLKHSSSVTAVLTQHNLAESAKIGHKMAQSTRSANGFDRPLMGSQPLIAQKTFRKAARFEHENAI